MMMNPRIVACWFGVIILLLSASCAHKSPGLSAYRPVASTEILRPPAAPKDIQNAATIVVKRDGGIAGSELTALVRVDGLEAARIPAGAYYLFQVAPGEHLVGVDSMKSGGLLGRPVYR
jgi:hypothetical protein